MRRPATRAAPALVLALLTWPPAIAAQDGGHHAHHHAAGADGSVVMNANPDTLPNGCAAVSGDEAVRAFGGAAFVAASTCWDLERFHDSCRPVAVIGRR